MLNSTCLAVLSVSLLLSFCNIHCFKCQIEVYSKYKHPKPMQGATPGPRFCALHRHSSRPPWGMCVHTSSGVSVGAPFYLFVDKLCSFMWVAHPPQKYRDSPGFFFSPLPGPALLFLRTETHASVPTASAIHPLCEDASQIYPASPAAR